MSDPVAAALEKVDSGADDPTEDMTAGLSESAPGEEADARPEGPLPDAVGVEDDRDEQDAKSAVLSWARSVPKGSHLDFDARDWWDPETGGKNRLAYHLSDLTEQGAGYPNGVGALVAVAEMYFSELRGGTSEDSSEETDASEVDGKEKVGRETAEGLV